MCERAAGRGSTSARTRKRERAQDRERESTIESSGLLLDRREDREKVIVAVHGCLLMSRTMA